MQRIGPSVLKPWRLLLESGAVAGLSDAQLLERFVRARDEASELAFAALVARHSPMVLGVCRRALADPEDADDAFQATFLVLVKKATSVRVDDSLGRWLYGVSRKVAARARIVALRRPRGGDEGLELVAGERPDPDRFELRAILNEELGRLPSGFRAAVVLCDLEGMTLEEAARDLLCPIGTIKSRLARGRLKLRERLEHRGVTPSALSLAPAVPASLVEATARASWMTLTSGPLNAGSVPAAAALLAQEVIKAMTRLRWKWAAAAVASMATGAGVLAGGQGADPAKPAQSEPAAEAGRNGRAVVGRASDPPREFSRVAMPEYVVEPPDMLAIEVVGALPGRPISGERLVRPDRSINLGFYGQVYVAGLTIPEIKAKVATHLREHLTDEALGLNRIDPVSGKVEKVHPARTNRVSVDVTAYNSKVYYIQGDVQDPSRVPVTGNDTVLDAINYAGGLTSKGLESRVRLVRPAHPGVGGASLEVDLKAIVSQGDSRTNYQLFPGDRLIVGEDHGPVPEAAKAPEGAAPAGVEDRLKAVERKLDEVLKVLDRLAKP